MSIFTELRDGIVTHSAEEMRAIAFKISQEISTRPDVTLALHGDLGAGKTTFTQGLAKGLGIQEAVTSPTFGIFTLHRGAGLTLVHLDAYRLENAHQLEDLMIDDFLIRPYVLVVEWPEKIAEWLPTNAIHLWLSIDPTEAHRIRVS